MQITSNPLLDSYRHQLDVSHHLAKVTRDGKERLVRSL
jgi:hypothetical protein